MRHSRRRPRTLRTTNEARCRRLLERSALIEVDDLDWDQVGRQVLDEGVLESLVYMRDVEGFTDSYLVGVGAHKTTLSDPLVAEFLRVWAREEAAHADAIDRYLTTYSRRRRIVLPPRAVAPMAQLGVRQRVIGRLGGPVGTLVAAGHMSWGAANELLTMNGYRLLADQCGDEVLAELLRRIAAQEARHYSFYLLQAEWRLAASRLARVALPRILDGSWTPVGIGEGYKTPAEFDRVRRVLGRRPEIRRLIDRMDRRFAQLPGFERLRIYHDAIAPRGHLT
jgi:rubrerythrin